MMVNNSNLFKETLSFLEGIGLSFENILYVSNSDRTLFILPEEIEGVFNKSYNNIVHNSSFVSVCSDLVIQLSTGDYLTRDFKDEGGFSREVWKRHNIRNKEVATDVFSRCFDREDPLEVCYDVKSPNKLAAFEDKEGDSEDSSDETSDLVYLTTLEMVSEHAKQFNIIYGAKEKEKSSNMCTSNDIIL